MSLANRRNGAPTMSAATSHHHTDAYMREMYAPHLSAQLGAIR